ncbi:MAG: hypothetical protein ACJAT2_002227 [Bacteriovoracaceae bacterium]|jgi:hypothetical protein
MKIILVFLIFSAMSFSTNSNASSMRSIECFFDGGGYDDEFIFLSTKDGVTKGFRYDSYRGQVPGFQKISERVYAHSVKSEKIYTVVSFNKELTKATMILNYKENGGEFFRQEFVCQ